MMRGTVLVVDDKPSMVELVARVLVGHHVLRAGGGADALAKIEVADVDVVVADNKMPDVDGLAVLAGVKARRPHAEVILMTAYASVESVVAAMRAGAFDYIAKPFEPEALVMKVERALALKQMRDNTVVLQDTVDEHFRFDKLIGRGPAMQQAIALLKKASAIDLTVLLLGETGTGKELAARAIHAASDRKSEPFIALNCGALPAELLESELFGHHKGAFTGATAEHRGLVETAAQGTLFLDEVGDLPLPLQVKLNRLLQDGSYRRVGDTKERTLQARIIAATNVGLEKRVAEGLFREDLYYRLKVFPVTMPPLRDRPEDLPSLVQHCVALAVERLRTPIAGPRTVHPGVLRALAAHRWPGNVRELRHVLERAVAIGEGNEIRVEDLPSELIQVAAAVPVGDISRLPYREAMEAITHQSTRVYLDALLVSVSGNVSRAAEKAGLARESLHRLLRKHGIDADQHR
jgi:DNA-binding NtrC family response regulator